MAELIRSEPSPSVPQFYQPLPYGVPLGPSREPSDVVREYIQVVYKRKWLIAAVALTVLAAAATETYTTSPSYTSTAQIQINTESPNVLPYQDIAQGPQYYYDSEMYQQTQFRLLRTQALGRRVAVRLNLKDDPAFSAPTSAGLLTELVPRAKATVRGLISRRKASERQERSSRQPTAEDLEALELGSGGRVVGSISVEPVKGSRLVDISCTFHDPELAAKIVNALVDEYIEMNFETRYKAAMMATEFLKKELEQLKIKVEKSDEALLNYAREHGILNIDERGNVVLPQLDALNAEMTKAQTEFISRSVQFETVKNATVEDFPNTLRNEGIVRVEERLTDLKQKLVSLSTKYGPDWPEIIQIEREITQVEEELTRQKQAAIARAKSEFRVAEEHFRRLTAALDEQRRVANRLNEDSIQYNILKREVETNKQLYEGLLQRLKEAGVSAGLRSSNINVVERGQVPGGPSAPNKSRDLTMGLLLGLVLGLGLALGIEYLDSSVKTPDELEQSVGLASLGVIPTIDGLAPHREVKRLPAAESHSDVAVIPYTPTKSRVWEAYRSLRASILLSHSGKPPQKIMITSALPGEGKTTTSINTAIVLAQTGGRTLIIDLDMRKPSVGSMFGLNGSQGMSTFLSGNSGLSSLLLPTDSPDLFVLPAGPQPPNPAELVGSDRMEKALRLLGEYFKYIVIDTPPVLSVADALVLSPMVDGVVLVIQGGKTPKDAVRKAKTQLQGVGAVVLGAMINNIDLQKAEYSYYYRYYYSHSYYYGDDEPHTSA